MQPPAPHVTVTKSGRKAVDMRSRRVWRLEKPSIDVNEQSQFREREADNLRFGREKLQREVMRVLGEGSNFVCELLHSSDNQDVEDELEMMRRN